MKRLIALLNPRKEKVDQHLAIVEADIEKSKQSKKAVKHALIEKNEKLQRTIQENHFTIRIFRATGGTIKQA